MRGFLVLKLPRTGSSMVGKVLDAHPSVECVNEYLNRYLDARRRVKIRALRSFYRSPPLRDPQGSDRVVGQTMNPFKYGLGAADIASAVAPFGLRLAGPRLMARRRQSPIRLIVLLRENLLKQAVSMYLARRRGKFEGSRHMIDDLSVVKRQVIDVPKLAGIVATLRNDSERLRQLATRLHAETMHVMFEQLQDDPVGTFESVFEYLRVPPAPTDFDYTAGFKKILSDDLRDVAENYEELERDPMLAPYLESEDRSGAGAPIRLDDKTPSRR
jgi:LPS sulfotransferase NodH